MMALWMGYAVAISALLGGAGAAAEVCLRALGRPSRWGVVGGLVASLALPAAALLAPREFLPGPPLGARFVPALDAAPLQAPGILANGGPISSLWSGLDTPLLAFWILGSFCTAMVGVFAQRRLVHSALECSPDSIDGTEVRRTRRLGPAVVGFLRGIIILPDWARSLEPESLRLSLAHEREHLRTRDPLLLFGCYLLVGLQPWNPALWWQLSRLKSSIETDCDQRVLAEGADPRIYASLLLELASRRSWNPPFALPLGKPRTRVGRRIVVMANGLVGIRPRSAVAAGLCSAALLLAVLQTPAPSQRPFRAGAGMDGTIQEAATSLPERSELLGAGQPRPESVTSLPASTPLPPMGPKVARGDDAMRIVDGLREKIRLGPGGDDPVEVLLGDGAVLRIIGIGESAELLVTMATLARPDTSGDLVGFRQITLRLELVEDEPVFTINEV